MSMKANNIMNTQDMNADISINVGLSNRNPIQMKRNEVRLSKYVL